MPSTPCSIEGCTGPAVSRGWCATHYSRWRRTGDPGTATRRYQSRDGRCQGKDCTRAVYAKGMCALHYMRQQRGADMDTPVRQSTVGSCSVDACDLPIYASGLCRAHHRSWNRYGDYDHVLVVTEGCRADECDEPHYSLGWCALHYARVKRTGTPEKPTVHRNFKGGYINTDGYRVMSNRGKPKLEHRLVMEHVIGRPLLSTENVHHRNGDRADNRPANLELWTTAAPPRQSVVDLVAWAKQIIKQYDKEAEREKRARRRDIRTAP